MIRRCTSDDKETIWNIISYAYSIPDTSRERILERLDSTGKQFFLSEVDGVPAVVARVLEFEQNVRGILKPMGGIGMVGCAPEYRRSGHTRDLMLSILYELRRNGFALSTLYPFKDTFYGDIGYVKMPPMKILEFNPNTLSGIKAPDGYSVKREEGEEMLQLRRKLYREMVLVTHGAVMRSEERWLEMTKNFALKAVVARNRKGNPEAMMVYSIKGYGEGHPWAETGQINVVEFTWTSLEGRDAILNYLYKHADQIIKVTMIISTRTDDFYHWLSNIHTPTLKSNIVSMARIIDVLKSLSDFPVKSSGVILVKVIDPQIKENNRTFEVKADDGLLSIAESNKKAKSTITIEGLTSILYGTLNEAQLRRINWLEGESPAELFDWFPPATPWLTEEF